MNKRVHSYIRQWQQQQHRKLCVHVCDMIKWQLNITCGTIISMVKLHPNTHSPRQTFIGDDAHLQSMENCSAVKTPRKKRKFHGKKVGKSVTDAIYYNHLSAIFALFLSLPPSKVSIFSPISIISIAGVLRKSKRNFHEKWKSLLIHTNNERRHRASRWVS